MRATARFLGAVAAIGCTALIAPAGASATDIQADITADVTADDGDCSLREALEAAQDNVVIFPGGVGGDDCPAGAMAPTSDTVQLGAATYAMAGPAMEDANASGDFDLLLGTAGPLVIDGVLGAGDVPQTVIDAADVDRIFDVQNSGDTVLDIQQVILRNGKPPEASSHGGAINIRDDNANFELNTARVENSDALGWGGGMSVNGSPMATDTDVDVIQVEFSGNDAVNDGGGLWIDGREQYGAFVVRRSAFIGNHTDDMGGGIYIRANGEDPPNEAVVEVYDSTISGNTADTTGGGIAFAFGIAGTLRLEYSTVANNSTPTAGEAGGIDLQDGEDEYIDGSGNILSGNTANGAPANCDDADGDMVGGAGVESGPVACFPTSTTIANPLLEPLSYNATGDQTTRTHALATGSPAIDKIAAGDCGSASDQRDIARPIGAGCDAGAFEAPLPAAAPGTPAATPTTPAAAKKCKKKKKKKKKRSLAGSAKKKKGCKKKKKKKK